MNIENICNAEIPKRSKELVLREEVLTVKIAELKALSDDLVVLLCGKEQALSAMRKMQYSPSDSSEDAAALQMNIIRIEMEIQELKSQIIETERSKERCEWELEEVQKEKSDLKSIVRKRIQVLPTAENLNKLPSDYRAAAIDLAMHYEENARNLDEGAEILGVDGSVELKFSFLNAETATSTFADVRSSVVSAIPAMPKLPDVPATQMLRVSAMPLKKKNEEKDGISAVRSPKFSVPLQKAAAMNTGTAKNTKQKARPIVHTEKCGSSTLLSGFSGLSWRHNGSQRKYARTTEEMQRLDQKFKIKEQKYLSTLAHAMAYAEKQSISLDQAVHCQDRKMQHYLAQLQTVGNSYFASKRSWRATENVTMKQGRIDGNLKPMQSIVGLSAVHSPLGGMLSFHGSLPRSKEIPLRSTNSHLRYYDITSFQRALDSSRRIVPGRAGAKGEQKPDNYWWDIPKQTVYISEQKNWSIENNTSPLRRELTRQIAERIKVYAQGYITPAVTGSEGFTTEKLVINVTVDLMGHMKPKDISILIGQYGKYDITGLPTTNKLRRMWAKVLDAVRLEVGEALFDSCELHIFGLLGDEEYEIYMKS